MADVIPKKIGDFTFFREPVVYKGGEILTITYEFEPGKVAVEQRFFSQYDQVQVSSSSPYVRIFENMKDDLMRRLTSGAAI